MKQNIEEINYKSLNQNYYSQSCASSTSKISQYFSISNKPQVQSSNQEALVYLQISATSKNSFKGQSDGLKTPKTPFSIASQAATFSKSIASTPQSLRSERSSFDSVIQEESQLYNNGDPFQIIIKLNFDIAPKACHNFLKLCQGFINTDGNYLTFRKTQALRFKKNGFIQFGFSKSGSSIFGGYFEDESYALKHDKAGIIGYCNKGVPHTNSNQFYITLAEMKGFDTKMVAFGRVISGLNHLFKINKYYSHENLSFNLVIQDSGVIQMPSINKQYASKIQILEEKDQENYQNESKKKQDIFKYVGEKPSKIVTFEQYFLQESALHKELGAQDYISLMFCLQTISFQVTYLLQKSYLYKTIEEIRNLVRQIFIKNLEESETVSIIYDICDDETIIQSNSGKFIVAFTSLDIQEISDISTCGSIFVIYRKATTSFKPPTKQDLLQTGEQIYGAGYFLYGQTTQIMIQTGNKLNCFSLDQESNIFKHTHARIKASKRSGIITFDDSKVKQIDENILKFLQTKKKEKNSYKGRYNGSKVANFHRTLIGGGILIYALKEINIFDAFAFCYLIDKAWDRSGSQDGQLLSRKPYNLQELVQVYMGYSQEVLEIDNLYLSIKRKNSLFKFHDMPSGKIKSNYYLSINNITSQTKI